MKYLINSSGNDIAAPLDASYYKGQGIRQGIEREFVVMECYPNITGALCANSHPGSYTGQDAFNNMLPVIRRNDDLLDETKPLRIFEGGGIKRFEK